MKILNILFVILFLVSAALQYNDPDPYLWMPIYVYGAFLCYLSIQKRYIRTLFLAGIIFYSVYALYLFFNMDGVMDWIRKHGSENIAQSMKATKPWIEQTREFFGLVILIVALSVNMAWLRGKNSIEHL
jgi:hypothetical protein